MGEKLTLLLESHQSLFVHQVREWAEILVDFETRNKYEILDREENKIGFIAEKNKGFWAALIRQTLNTHRPMEIVVWDNLKEEVLRLERPFYWIWSDLTVSSLGRKVGSIHRRFAFLHKVYDLRDISGRVFARIKAPFWRLWTFPIFNLPGERQVGVITKNWGGVIKEVFSDADKFQVQFPKWEPQKKAIVLAAAISIDLDYFEKNSKSVTDWS